MREKLIKLLEQAKYCSVEELADYLLAAGLILPDGKIDFDYNAEDVKHGED